MLGKIKLLSQTQHTIQIDKNTFAVITHDRDTII